MATSYLNKYLVRAEFEATANDNKAAGAYGLGVTIPDNAVITNAFVDVVTAFSDAGDTDTATIALHVEGANDLVAGTAIGAGTVYAEGVHGTLAGSPELGSNATTLDSGTSILYAKESAASMIKTTANREVTATVATNTLDAGKMYVYVEFVISE